MNKYLKNIDDFNKANGLDIVCLGFKRAFGEGGPGTGNKMWYYKLRLNNKEYLIVDANMIALLDMVWTEDDEFENSDLSDEILDKIQSQISNNGFLPAVRKVQKELAEDEENTFFTQHNIPEPEPEVEEERKNGIYTANEVNTMLSLFSDSNLTDDGAAGFITQEMADFANQENYGRTLNCWTKLHLLDELVGYEVECSVDGDHRNDGQMVDYSFTLTSPSGEVTDFSTEMCLMVGWNYHENLQIK